MTATGSHYDFDSLRGAPLVRNDILYTVDFGDVGKVACDKESIKENEAGGRYFPSENFTLK